MVKCDLLSVFSFWNFWGENEENTTSCYIFKICITFPIFLNMINRAQKINECTLIQLRNIDYHTSWRRIMHLNVFLLYFESKLTRLRFQLNIYMSISIKTDYNNSYNMHQFRQKICLIPHKWKKKNYPIKCFLYYQPDMTHIKLCDLNDMFRSNFVYILFITMWIFILQTIR